VRGIFDVFEVVVVAGVCQQVVIDDLAVVSVFEHVDDKVRAYEARATGYKYFFHVDV
jgi:hypothetical protein